MPVETRRISEVQVGSRYRKDLGDVTDLVQSIEEIGLLHPIVITPKGRLIAGQRRLAACSELGWTDVPVNIVDLAEIVRGEFDENTMRKNFLPSEIAAIVRDVRPLIEAATVRGRPRKGADSAPLSKGETRDKVAQRVGVSHDTITKIETVVKAAEAEPEKYKPMLELMDGKAGVNVAYRKTKEQQKVDARPEETIVELPEDISTDNGAVQLLFGEFQERLLALPDHSVDLIVTDPPYQKVDLPLWSDLSALAARVLQPRGILFAYTGKIALPEVINRLAEHLNYGWEFALMLPGSQSRIYGRHLFQAWKPILAFTRKTWPSDDWGDDVLTSPKRTKGDYEWQQSVAPAQRLIERFSVPGAVILDPFLGVGTTGIAARQAGRRFIGVENDAGRFKKAAENIRVGER